MERVHGFRTSFDKDEYDSKGSPRNGKISPGRSMYTDDFYDDENVLLSEFEDRPDIWDLEEFHIQHPDGQGLVGDDLPLSHYGKGPKGYTRSDALIHEEVCEALKEDPKIDASQIDVTIDKGIVFLKGSVPHRRMKKEAEYCIEEVLGVKDIFNEIEIQPEERKR